MPRPLVNIDVDDLPRAIASYRDALTCASGASGHGVELLGECAGLPAAISLRRHAGEAGVPRRYGRHWTPVHLTVVETSPPR